VAVPPDLLSYLPLIRAELSRLIGFKLGFIALPIRWYSRYGLAVRWTLRTYRSTDPPLNGRSSEARFPLYQKTALSASPSHQDGVMLGCNWMAEVELGGIMFVQKGEGIWSLSSS